MPEEVLVNSKPKQSVIETNSLDVNGTTNFFQTNHSVDKYR